MVFKGLTVCIEHHHYQGKETIGHQLKGHVIAPIVSNEHENEATNNVEVVVLELHVIIVFNAVVKHFPSVVKPLLGFEDDVLSVFVVICFTVCFQQIYFLSKDV